MAVRGLRAWRTFNDSGSGFTDTVRVRWSMWNISGNLVPLGTTINIYLYDGVAWRLAAQTFADWQVHKDINAPNNGAPYAVAITSLTAGVESAVVGPVGLGSGVFTRLPTDNWDLVPAASVGANYLTDIPDSVSGPAFNWDVSRPGSSVSLSLTLTKSALAPFYPNADSYGSRYYIELYDTHLGAERNDAFDIIGTNELNIAPTPGTTTLLWDAPRGSGITTATFTFDVTNHTFFTVRAWTDITDGFNTTTHFDGVQQYLDNGVAAAAPPGTPPLILTCTWLGWGANFDGCTGLGDFAGHNSGPVPWSPTWPYLVQVASGGNFCAGVDASGKVWTWGAGISYRLGHGDLLDHTAATIVTDPNITNIVEVACLAEATFARRNDGNIYFVGFNVLGANGEGPGAVGTTYSTWTLCTNWSSHAITRMVGGDEAIVMQQGDGTVWFAGSAQYGEAGNGSSGGGHGESVPIQWSAFTDIIDATIGLEDVLVVRAGGAVYGSGRNNLGALLDGTTTPRLVPTLATNAPASVARVFGWARASYFITTTGALYGGGHDPPNLSDTTAVLQDVGGKAVASVSQGWTPDNVFALATDGTLWGIPDNSHHMIDGGAAFYVVWTAVWPAVLTNVTNFLVCGDGEDTILAVMCPVIIPPITRQRAYAFLCGV